MKLAQYKLIAKNVQDDLAEVLKKYGLELKPFGARIDERLGVVKMSIEARDVNHVDAGGNATSPERELFKQYAGLYEMKQEWLGQKMTFSREEYTLEGLRSGRAAKNVAIKRARDGKTFYTSPEEIVRYFAFVASRAQPAQQQGAAR